MKDLQEYIEESLLDVDDLEKKSSNVVEKILSIGNQYTIDSINDTYGDLFDFLDKSVLKKLKNIWNSSDFRILKPHPKYAYQSRTLKPNKISIQLANAILSLNKDCLYVGKLDDSNDIYKLFYTLFENWIKKDDVKLTIQIEKILNRIIIRVNCVTIDYHYDSKYTREFVISLIRKE